MLTPDLQVKVDLWAGKLPFKTEKFFWGWVKKCRAVLWWPSWFCTTLWTDEEVIIISAVEMQFSTRTHLSVGKSQWIQVQNLSLTNFSKKKMFLIQKSRKDCFKVEFWIELTFWGQIDFWIKLNFGSNWTLDQIDFLYQIECRS